MDARLVYALRGIPQRVIIEELGWNVFLKYKAECYAQEPQSFRDRCDLLRFLGMTEAEHCDWETSGKVSDRLKRVWS